MKRRLLAWLAVMAIVTLALGAPGIGLASNGNGSGGGSGGTQGHEGSSYGCFDDVDDGNWAYRDITKMEVKGVFGGYGNGKFGPQDSVSCLQLAILAVRVSGSQDAALALTPEAVDAALAGGWLDPADPVPAWPGARECLAYAYLNGYLDGFITQEQVMFRPTAAATRLEVVVTLIDAMGLTDAAAALATAPITAPDSATVPAWANGYVSLALNMGLLKGDSTGVLKINAAVTRAEMAALLCRSSDESQTEIDHRTMRAKLVSVTSGDAPSITVELRGEQYNDYIGVDDDEEDDEDEAPPATDPPATDPPATDPPATDPPATDPPATDQPATDPPQAYDDDALVTMTFPLGAGCVIFRDGVTATIDQLLAGDRVEIRMDAAGSVVYIDASAPKVDSGDGTYEVGGPYVSSALGTDGALTSITIVVARVRVDDEEDEDDEDEGGQPAPGTGEAAPGSNLVVGEQATFTVSADVVFKGGKDASAATLVEGDYVTLKVKADTVVKISVNRGDEDESDEDEEGDDEDEEEGAASEGRITAVFVSTDGTTLTVTVTEGDQDLPDYAVDATVTLNVADDLEISGLGNGEDDPEPTLADLVAGATLTISIEDGVATEIRVAGSEGQGDREGSDGERDGSGHGDGEHGDD